MGEYIKNRDLEALWHRWTAGDQEAAEEMLAALYLIAQRLFSRYQFLPLDRSELVQDCVTHAWLTLDRFQPGRARLFNFVTTMLMNQARYLYRSHRSRQAGLERFWKRKNPSG